MGSPMDVVLDAPSPAPACVAVDPDAEESKDDDDSIDEIENGQTPTADSADGDVMFEHGPTPMTPMSPMETPHGTPGFTRAPNTAEQVHAMYTKGGQTATPGSTRTGVPEEVQVKVHRLDGPELAEQDIDLAMYM